MHSSHETDSAPTPGRRFKRRWRGYNTNLVDDSMARLELRVVDLESQAVELREELLDSQHSASEAKHDLTRLKAELRYWNDRASYIDSEVARARQRAVDLEQEARQRAEAIESDAQERSLQLIDRVCSEANAMLQAAREEAREMFLRFETDVDMSQQKLEKLEAVRTDVATTMQRALEQFEGAVRELDSVGPAKRIVEALEPPARRANPSFGQRKALEAAGRFAQSAEHSATASMSTPLEHVLTANVEDAAQSSVEQVPTETETEAAPAASPTVGTKRYNADDEFASLLMQP
jgi:hypothetical protein